MFPLALATAERRRWSLKLCPRLLQRGPSCGSRLLS